MNYVRYDKSTRMVVGSCVAPAGCVPVGCTEFDYLQVDSFPDGECYVDDGFQVKPCPAKPNLYSVFDYPSLSWVDAREIDEFKQAAKQAMTAERDRREFGTFTWRDKVYDTNEVVRMRLQAAYEGARLALAASDTTWEQPWVIADNSAVVLSPQDVISLYTDMWNFTRGLHTTCGMLHVLIDMATTVEQVQAITWPEDV